MPSIHRKRGIYPAPYVLGIGAVVVSILLHFCICIILSEAKILNLKEMEFRIKRLSVDLVKVPSKSSEMERLESTYSSPAETSILRKSAEEILKDAHNFYMDEASPALSPLEPSIQPANLSSKYDTTHQRPDILDSVNSSLPEESASRDELASVPGTSMIDVPRGRKVIGAITVPALKQEELYFGRSFDLLLPRQPTLQVMEPVSPPMQPQSFAPESEAYSFMVPSVTIDKAVKIERVETGNYKSLTNDVDVEFSVYPEAKSGHQFFKVSITPRQEAVFTPIPKDVVFAIDVSYSISNKELMEIRSALNGCLKTLNRSDRFNLVIFSTECKWLFSDFQEITSEKVKTAITFIDRLPDTDMTDIYASLTEIMQSINHLQQKSQQDYERPCNVILISDGKPTTGIKDVREIVGEFVHIRPANTSIFTFDIGKRGNRYLLDLIAFESRGYSKVEESVSMGGSMLSDFLRRYKDPLLLHMVVNYANLEEGDIYPRVLPNLYRGENIEIYGTCQPDSEVALRIVGDAYGEKCELTIAKNIPAGGNGSPEIAREWATRKAYYLISRVALEGPKEEWLTEIDKLREEYSINVPYSIVPGNNWFENIVYRFIK